MTTLVLNFRQAAQNPVGTVVLDFVLNGDVQPIPIAEPNITMAVTAGYRHKHGRVIKVLQTRWASGDITAQTRLSWSSTPVTIKLLHTSWQTTPLTMQQAGVSWSCSWPLVVQQIGVSWGGYRQLSAQIKTLWAEWPVVGVQLQASWLPSLNLQQLLNRNHWQRTGITERSLDVFYNQGNDIKQGYTLPYGPKPPSYICSNDYRPQKGTVTLNFTELATPRIGTVTLNFSNVGNPIFCVLDNGGGLIWPLPDLPTIDTTKPITPPRRRSYIMQPQLRCYRVSDNQEVNIIIANWSISRSQWGANISLVCGSRGDKDLLFAGGPQEFKLVINGYEFYGLAEEPGVSAQFGQTTWTVSGRSSNAALATPHVAPRSYSNATAKSIAALALDELLGTGWALDYQPTLYNVPAGAFSYQNKTPIEAIAQIAQAVGAMVYPDGETKTLHIVPQWPVAPWAINTATADVAVHDDVIINYSAQPVISPLFNKVFVRGEQQGVEGGVRRTGTAGDKLAPDVVDPLITDNIAARQRGTAVLSDSGNKDNINLVLPIMQLLPPCLPGQVLGVTWQTEVYKALVDSVQISAQRGNDGTLTVRQTVGALRSHE